MKPDQPGKLRHRITFQRQEDTKDNAGRIVGNWIDVRTCSAEIITLSGNEAEIARQLIASATHRIRIRATRVIQLTTKHRISFRGRIFSIGHIDDVEQMRVWLDLTCSEVRA